MVGEQRLVVVPGQGGDVEEGLGVGGQLRQHRLEEDHQLAEQVDAGGAYGLDLGLLAFLLGQGPGRLVGDPGVGAVGQGHDFAHGAGEVTVLVGFGDARRGGLEVGEQFRRGVLGHQLAGIALVDEAGATAGDVHHLAHQVGVDLLHEVLEVQVEVVDAAAELGRIVVAQVLRAQVVEVGARLDEGAAGLGHLLPVHRQVAVHVQRGGLAVAGAFEHGGPEQGVEVDDVLADEVVQLGLGVLVPEGVEVQFGTAYAEVLEAGHVADGGVQPDVEVLAGGVRDFEAEVGGITADVPLLQAGVQPFGDLVGHRLLQRTAAGPLLEHGVEVRQLEEVVQRLLEYRGGAGDRGLGVLQLGGRVGGAAGFAVVAVLVVGAALRAGTLDEAVGQEHFLVRVEILGHRAGGDVAGVAQLGVDAAGEDAVLFRVGRMVVVEVHQEGGEVGGVLGAHVVDQLLRGDAFLLGAQHDGRAVGVVGADVDGLVATHLLEAHPDVGLDVFDHMPEVDGPVGIGKGACHEDLAGLGHGARLPDMKRREVGNYIGPARFFHPWATQRRGRRLG
ncbi:hypothetical protein D3C78_829430 [compost metagenome]